MIDIFNPATGEIIERLPDGGAAAVDRAVQDAAMAFQEGVWLGLDAGKRASILFAIAGSIEANLESLAQEEAINCGMPVWLGRILIQSAADVFRYYAGAVERISGIAKEVRAQGRAFHGYTRREPIGVVGLITPWNVPFLLAAQKVAPALAAGCTVVIKPAEETPLTTLRLQQLMAEAGLPRGVVTVVVGRGATAGAALVEHPLVRKISFTGSGEVGKEIVRAAAGNLKRVTLELGGKSPVLVLKDADVERAAQTAAWGVFANSGQACTAGSRIYAHSSVYAQVVDGLVKAAREMRVGEGTDSNTQLGPLISSRHLDRVLAYVQSGREAGAEVLTGGMRVGERGFFMAPTVFANTRSDMAIVREEIFGPVATVSSFDDLDDVIAEANESDFGLSAAVWTRDLKSAHQVAARLEAGTVAINSSHLVDVHLPFGGFKQSGWGGEYGDAGLEAFLQSKSIYAALD